MFWPRMLVIRLSVARFLPLFVGELFSRGVMPSIPGGCHGQPGD